MSATPNRLLLNPATAETGSQANLGDDSLPGLSSGKVRRLESPTQEPAIVDDSTKWTFRSLRVVEEDRLLLGAIVGRSDFDAPEQAFKLFAQTLGVAISNDGYRFLLVSELYTRKIFLETYGKSFIDIQNKKTYDSREAGEFKNVLGHRIFYARTHPRARKRILFECSGLKLFGIDYTDINKL